jgi:GrpB-like predicted nucleotidyltransferase (UPF0157 family)
LPIIIVEYDPLWPIHFQQVRQELLTAMDDLVNAIEHVGSTAVPGLAAKPFLDIDIVIRSTDQFPHVIERMKSLGYQHQGDLGITGRHAFKQPPTGPLRHVYVCAVGAAPLREHLAFRDHLRQSPDDRFAYAQLKKELANTIGDDRNLYTDRKTEFIRNVLLRAIS